jgi:outer membrane murein-binding lipoprotein Lpp
MNESFLLVLAVLAVVLAAAALAVALLSLRRGGATRRTARRVSELPTDVQGLRAEVHALRTEVSDALRHLAVVRYDAFGDMGGHLSWSLALLDDAGNGVVLTSIHGRSDARTYAKNVSDWTCDQQTSPEEEEAIKFARTG